MTDPILIVGAGPTGLGAAWRLQELGYDHWLLIDRLPYVGGLATSFHDEQGFTYDFAIHVAHSHYDYVDCLMDTVLPNGFLHLERRSWIRVHDAWIPYPFQYNFRHLPWPARDECLEGLRALERQAERVHPANFHQWLLQSFGRGIAEHFMLPYNRKNWAIDPAAMGWLWLGDRVPVVDLERVERNLRNGRDDVSWGPNFNFRFPREGGTGAIWKALEATLPENRIRLNTGLVALDIDHRQATLSDGSKVQYDTLISTIPLSQLVAMTGRRLLIDDVARLRHTRVQVVCLACEFPMPEELRDKTWVYCPDDQTIFYRVTPFSNFSPSHVPDPARHCSFLCEVATPGDGQAWPRDVLEQRTLMGFAVLGLAPVTTNNTRFFHLDAPYGYPVPTTDRDQVLHRVIPELDSLRIYSRGRFGGWKYEVANMDHSIMQGVEVVNRILLGEEETTWRYPHLVNARKR